MPDLTVETIHASRRFNEPRARLYAHWISPETRARWEAGPDSGMRYDGFDTRPGGLEIVRVIHQGTEVGHLSQRISAMREGEMVASQIEGHFGRQVTMIMQVVVRFVDDGDGCRIEAVSQVTDLTGREIREEHEKGWSWILGRIAEDIATHGLIGPDPP